MAEALLERVPGCVRCESEEHECRMCHAAVVHGAVLCTRCKGLEAW